MVYAFRKLYNKKVSPVIKYVRNYSKYNKDLFCDDLRNTDWEYLKGVDESVDNQWHYFNQSFMRVVDRHAPLMFKKKRGIDQPWMTRETTTAIRNRNARLKKARKTNSEHDLQTYRSMRNQVTSLIRKSKSTYNQKLIERNSSNPKSFWKIIKRILPHNTKARLSGIMVDGNLESDRKVIATKFNDYFCKSTRRLRQSLTSVVSGVSSNIHHVLVASTLYTRPIFQFVEITEQFTKDY